MLDSQIQSHQSSRKYVKEDGRSLGLPADKIKTFNEQGYLTLAPGECLGASTIEFLASMARQQLLPFEAGIVDPTIVNSRTDPRFRISYAQDKVIFNGLARNHRYTRAQGSPDRMQDTNWLLGKRGILTCHRWSKDMAELIEDPKMLYMIRQFFNCEELSFHNGALHAVYPGCTGESMSLHADTKGFLPDQKAAYIASSAGKYLVNVLIHLNDVTEELAPMRVFPKTHLQYAKINKHLAKIFGRPEDENCLYQAGQLYEELLPDFVAPPVSIIGKKGTVTFMHSNLLHAATENKCKDAMRHAITLNYSRRQDIEFRKEYYGDREYCKKFVSFFKDKGLVNRTYVTSSEPIPLARRSKAELIHVAKEGLQFADRVKQFVVYRGGNLINENPSKIPLDQKKYLNVGAGGNWRHRDVICLEFNPIEAEVAFNLDLKEPLPFPSNRFEGIYTSHNLEHLKESSVIHIVKEMHRCLKPGGIARITGPDIEAYDAKNVRYFDWLRTHGAYAYDSWLRLIVRAFADSVVDNYSDTELQQLYHSRSRNEFLDFFTAQVETITDDNYLWPQVHKSWHSPGKMIALLKSVGFSQASKTTGDQTKCPVFADSRYFNQTRPHMSFFVEGVK